MSLKENKYIRYFGGHDKRVVTLAMNPADDTFLSGSLDKSIRLWDLRSNHCQVRVIIILIVNSATHNHYVRVRV